MSSISDKRIVLITGANSGIGFDASYALVAASSNTHVIMSARNDSKGKEAVKNIQDRKPQGTVSFLNLDTTSDSSIAAAAEKLQEDFGRIDVLVNNAGVCPNDPPTRDSFRVAFETNVFGTTLLTEALVPLLQQSKDPRIINVSSGLGSISLRGDSSDQWYQVNLIVYRTSKTALNMLSACQRENYKNWPTPAKVWAFCPGYVITNLTGEEDRKNRQEQGADSSETSAQGILEIVNGDRDVEAGRFVQRYGKQFDW